MALGLELRARGHQVAIATSAFYQEKIRGEGLDFHLLRPDINPSDKDTIRKTMDERKGSEAVIKGLMMPTIRETYADLLTAVEGADLLVASELAYAGPIVAEVTGIPWASVTLSPLPFFSTTDPSVLPAPWPVNLSAAWPPAYRAVLWLARREMRGWADPISALRQDLGLPRGADPFFVAKHSPSLVLAMFSRLLAAPQPDWPPGAMITGFPFYDRHASAHEPSTLHAFLDAGDPPIVFTLGSAAVFDPGVFFDESVRAARLVGRRALLLVGPEPDRAPASSADVGVFDYAPFSTLFPRAAAIVHQGGVGTTAQAMRAGRPMLVVPYAHDQPDNASRLVRLGVARTVPRRRYHADRVAKELRVLIEDPEYSRKAAAVGDAVRHENGARAGADAVERLLAEKRGSA
jgi:UDP:flavonoid glycosyltransferase YjiC (YdhE family)